MRPRLGYTHTHTHTHHVLLSSSSNWEEAACTLLRTEVLEEWVDCRGVSTVPCLRAQVNLTASNQTAFLHFDEEPVLHALEVRISAASSQSLSGSSPEEEKKPGLQDFLGGSGGEIVKMAVGFIISLLRTCGDRISILAT